MVYRDPDLITLCKNELLAASSWTYCKCQRSDAGYTWLLFWFVSRQVLCYFNSYQGYPNRRYGKSRFLWSVIIKVQVVRYKVGVYHLFYVLTPYWNWKPITQFSGQFLLEHLILNPYAANTMTGRRIICYSFSQNFSLCRLAWPICFTPINEW